MDKALFAVGEQTRRAVLGDRHVDSSLAAATEFTRPLQELVTEYGWGAVWSRPGLPRKIRSMLNLAMLTALNRPHELKTHVRGALANGVTVEEMKELILQVAIYCGVPAAHSASRVVAEVLEKK